VGYQFRASGLLIGEVGRICSGLGLLPLARSAPYFISSIGVAEWWLLGWGEGGCTRLVGGVPSGVPTRTTYNRPGREASKPRL
jgi:hypothetical protein